MPKITFVITPACSLWLTSLVAERNQAHDASMWHYAIGTLRDSSEAHSLPVWRHSRDICALADDDRHLGHIVRTDQWQAFDAAKPNVTSNGFRHLGSFASVSAAKGAVEKSIMGQAVPVVRCAGQ